MRKYAKAWVAILGAVLVSVGVALESPGISTLEAVVIVTAFVTAFGVYMVPNLPE